jgi:phospholipid transport system transporter-binding protein
MDHSPASVLALPAVANLGAAAALASSLQAQMESGHGSGSGSEKSSGPVRVDGSALQVYDTSTVALLLQLRRLAQAEGRPFELQALPAKLVQLAQLYGVEELLDLPAGD